VIGKSPGCCTPVTAVRKVVTFGTLADSFDTLLGSFVKPITECDAALGFVVVQGSAEIPWDKPMECHFHISASDLSLDLLPCSSGCRIATHLVKATPGFSGAVVRVGEHRWERPDQVCHQFETLILGETTCTDFKFIDCHGDSLHFFYLPCE